MKVSKKFISCSVPVQLELRWPSIELSTPSQAWKGSTFLLFRISLAQVRNLHHPRTNNLYQIVYKYQLKFELCFLNVLGIDFWYQIIGSLRVTKTSLGLHSHVYTFHKAIVSVPYIRTFDVTFVIFNGECRQYRVNS